jgi:hypothetical protein
MQKSVWKSHFHIYPDFPLPCQFISAPPESLPKGERKLLLKREIRADITCRPSMKGAMIIFASEFKSWKK